ncbi:SAF domain-containing protein [Egicoccus sp. AB-alg6-2]|uniref:SAF domain-containing protein n=1 Tax=Egicoccus sp. AB-alg6-2 TaxID=3242692 RepID=UPI00359DB008
MPRPLDAVSEWWFRAGPRLRFVLAALVVIAALGGYVVRMTASPWGPPVAVLVAATDLPLGHEPTSGDVRSVRWPAQVVPDDVVTEVDGARLTVAVPAGTALTSRHFADGGIAGALSATAAAIAIERELLPELPPGARIDLVGAGHDGTGTVLAGDVAVLRVDDARVWVEVPRELAAEVAGAAAARALTAVLLPP